jgi:hypothetical protein
MNVVTTLENAEFAQSYRHHDKIPRRSARCGSTWEGSVPETILWDRRNRLPDPARQRQSSEARLAKVHCHARRIGRQSDPDNASALLKGYNDFAPALQIVNVLIIRPTRHTPAHEKPQPFPAFFMMKVITFFDRDFVAAAGRLILHGAGIAQTLLVAFSLCSIPLKHRPSRLSAPME